MPWEENDGFYQGVCSLPETDGPCVVYMDFRPGNILINDNKVMMPSVRLPGVKKGLYIELKT